MEHVEHKVRRIGIREKGGAALIAAMAFVFFLTLFGLAFYRLGETDIDLFGQDKDLSKALYASEAGIEKVRWMLREVPAANPFDKTFNEATAISIANPTGGDFFPGEEDKAYYKVAMIQDASILDPTVEGKVRVWVLGSLDVDADGEAGLTASEDVFTYDPDDVNRRFEAYIGLPGTLGLRFGIKGISAAAGAFYAGGAERSLLWESRPFVTPDGDQIKDQNGDDRFLFYRSYPSIGIWDKWGFIFSDPAPTIASGEIDEIELPPGIFDTDGTYIDEDNNGIPDYFQDLNLRIYTGAQTFNASNDPTAAPDGRSVIYVNGDITIEGVDFGHLNDQGEVRNCDWEGYPPERFDLTFIANGDITVDRVDCGHVGRLVLVGTNITFVGDYDTKVNGIAIAWTDITLDGSGCTNGILTHQTDFSRPVKYTAYFLGSMVAGNHINLQNDGWTVIYDENVINGIMYSTTMLKPTLTYERAEAADFTSSNNWRVTNDPTPELLHKQGIYTQDEIIALLGDSNDPGDDNDELPELMRIYTNRNGWGPKPTEDCALNETLSLNFPIGVFEDPDILAVTQPDGSQNWDFYDTITFWMALDNFIRESTDKTKTTRREARYQIRLRDSDGNTISFPLENFYPESGWGTVKYHHTGTPEEYMNEIRDLDAGEKANGETYSSWKRVKISLNKIDPTAALDLGSLVEFDIRYVDMTVSWTVDPTKPNRRVIWYDNRYFRYYDEDGNWDSIDGKDNQGDLNNDPPSPNDGYYYLYDDSDFPDINWFRWIEDPDSSTEIRMREEVLMPTLRIDRIELPGKPATNDYLNYGFPHCLRFEVTNWQEFRES